MYHSCELGRKACALIEAETQQQTIHLTTENGSFNSQRRSAQTPQKFKSG